MNEEQQKLLQDQMNAFMEKFSVQVDAKIEDSTKSWSAQFEDLLNKLEGMPSNETAGFITNDGGEADKGVKSFGDFCLAVKRNDVKRLTKVYGSSIDNYSGIKTMTEDDGASGGWLVPDEEMGGLRMFDENPNLLSNRVTQINVTRPTGEWVTLDQFTAATAGVGETPMAGGVTSTATPEAGQLTATEPNFEMLNFRLHKIGGYTPVSNELLADSPVAIEGLLRSLYGMAVVAKKEYFILRGSGVGEPLGILNAGTDILENVTPATNSLFSWPDVATMESRFKELTGQGIWVMHKSLIPDLMTMELGTAGGNVWMANMAGGQGYQLNGRPILFSEHLPQANSAGAAILIDPKAYVTFNRGGLSIAYSEHVGFLTDTATFRFTTRMDGMPWLQSKFTLSGPGAAYTVSPFVVHND